MKKIPAKTDGGEHEQVDSFMARYASGYSGEKLMGAGAIATYTFNWPEFKSYDDGTQRIRKVSGYDFSWKNNTYGNVNYEGRSYYLPGVKRGFKWTAVYSCSYLNKRPRGLLISIEYFDSNRIWQSHEKLPAMWDYRSSPQKVPYLLLWSDGPVSATDHNAAYDRLDPRYYDRMDIDQTLFRKILLNAKKFVKKFTDVAHVDDVIWHSAGVDIEDPTPKKTLESEDSGSYEQIGGDYGDPWAYGGVWFNSVTGQLVATEGCEDDDDVDAGDKAVDSMLTHADYVSVLDALSIDVNNEWENTLDDVRQKYADSLTSSRAYKVYRTTVDSDEVIESDWADHVAAIKSENNISDDDWAAMQPAAKEAEIATRVGWIEFDHYPDKYTKKELEKMLGLRL